MSKKYVDDFDVLDDYYEDEGDDFLFNQVVESDLSNVSYEDFNKANDDYEEDDDDDEIIYQEVKPIHHTTTTIKKTKKHSTHSSIEDKMIENESLMDVLSVFWIWFRRLGIVIAVILIAYYLTQGLFKELFAYLFALVIAFFFGFAFMAVLTKVKDNR